MRLGMRAKGLHIRRLPDLYITHPFFKRVFCSKTINYLRCVIVILKDLHMSKICCTFAEQPSG